MTAAEIPPIHHHPTEITCFLCAALGIEVAAAPAQVPRIQLAGRVQEETRPKRRYTRKAA